MSSACCKGPGDAANAAAAAVVAIHLRELPSTALDALIDLIVSGGPQALIFAITDELASRHPKHFCP
jgi:hypothetical protein